MGNLRSSNCRPRGPAFVTSLGRTDADLHEQLNRQTRELAEALERFGAVVARPYSADFTTDIAESSFRYTQVSARMAARLLELRQGVHRQVTENQTGRKR
jgi:hypothetical protein